LARITSDPVWLGRAEEVAFNPLPAAMTPDLKGPHYFTAPNQVRRVFLQSISVPLLPAQRGVRLALLC
ncbi:MAG: hypothetical protein ACRD9L_19505, partial [Bryobacteraceae bacterium]